VLAARIGAVHAAYGGGGQSFRSDKKNQTASYGGQDQWCASQAAFHPYLSFVAPTKSPQLLRIVCNEPT
jgi:hypothetical protein